MDRPPPGRGWYALAVVLLAVGVTAFGLALSRAEARLGRQVEGLSRVAVPAEEKARGTSRVTVAEGAKVTVREAGVQTIFYEYRGRLDRPSWEGPDVDFDTPVDAVWPQRHEPAMRVTVRGPRGEPMEAELLSDRRVVVYQRPEGAGFGVWTFVAPDAGVYTLDARWVDEPPEGLAARGSVLLAVGRWEAQPWSREMWYAAAVLAFCFTAAAVTGIVTWMLRSGSATPRGQAGEARRLGEANELQA